MNILVLTAHPDLGSSSINKSWFDALSNTSGITTRDLMAVGGKEMTFDPVVEQALLLKADRIVLQFPFYWYSSPPVLKAWLDQVLLAGFAYGPGGDKLRGKALMLAISTGGPAMSYAHGAYNRLPISAFLTPFEQTANMVGMRYLPPFVLYSAIGLNDFQKETSTASLIAHISGDAPMLDQAV